MRLGTLLSITKLSSRSSFLDALFSAITAPVRVCDADVLEMRGNFHLCHRQHTSALRQRSSTRQPLAEALTAGRYHGRLQKDRKEGNFCQS